MKHYSIFLLSWLISFPSVVASQNMAMYADPNCSTCKIDIPESGTRTLYVRGPSGPTGPFVAPLTFGGGRFRITGIPAGWMINNVVSSAGVLVVGDLVNGGVGVAMNAVNGWCAPMLSFSLTATTAESNVSLSFAPADNSIPDCVFMTFLDGSVLFNSCFTPSPFFINSNNSCTVDLEEATWSVIKALYGEEIHR